MKYDTKTNQFVYECLTSEGDVLYKKDLLNRIFDCKDEQTKKFMSYMASDNVLFHFMDTKYMRDIKEIFVSFAKMIDIINTNQWNVSSGLKN